MLLLFSATMFPLFKHIVMKQTYIDTGAVQVKDINDAVRTVLPSYPTIRSLSFVVGLSNCFGLPFLPIR